MSYERPDRGNLFEHAQKQKPSQPGYHGDCTIDGTDYEIRGWLRDDRLAISLAPRRGDTNKYPPDVFRGALDRAAPARPSRGPKDDTPTPVWSGDITSDEAVYSVRAFEKQGKSGPYLTLTFERIEAPAQDALKSS
jgi:hypothetical protein